MKPLSNNELSMFCGQMSMILHSGISSTEGLSLMAEDSPEQGKELLESLISNMEETGIFHQSIRDTKVFPEYMCNMIQIGEESGRLDEVMSALSEHYEQQETISRSIKNAITYPFIMITMMLAVILVLIVKVMPVFNQVYEQLGTGLTWCFQKYFKPGNPDEPLCLCSCPSCRRTCGMFPVFYIYRKRPEPIFQI